MLRSSYPSDRAILYKFPQRMIGLTCASRIIRFQLEYITFRPFLIRLFYLYYLFHPALYSHILMIYRYIDSIARNYFHPKKKKIPQRPPGEIKKVRGKLATSSVENGDTPVLYTVLSAINTYLMPVIPTQPTAGIRTTKKRLIK